MHFCCRARWMGGRAGWRACRVGGRVGGMVGRGPGGQVARRPGESAAAREAGSQAARQPGGRSKQAGWWAAGRPGGQPCCIQYIVNHHYPTHLCQGAPCSRISRAVAEGGLPASAAAACIGWTRVSGAAVEIAMSVVGYTPLRSSSMPGGRSTPLAVAAAGISEPGGLYQLQ